MPTESEISQRAWIHSQPLWLKTMLYARTPFDARVALGMPTTLSDILTLQKFLVTTPSTVANLPAVGTKGRRAFVTDANAVTFQSIVAGGGTNNVPVFDDGTNWRIG